MITKILYNGSKFAGQQSDSIEVLLNVLVNNALDPMFEDFGNFIYEFIPAKGWSEETENLKGCTMISGNFLTYSHSFGIITNDPELINTLTAAIRSSQQRTEYIAAKVNYLAEKRVKEIATQKFHAGELELQQLYYYPQSVEGEHLLEQIKNELTKELTPVEST